MPVVRQGIMLTSWYEPAAQPAHHQAVSRLSAAAMQLAQRIPAPELESAMASLHPLPGSVLYFDPLGLLRLVPDRTRTNVLLTWDAASDPRVLDTLYRSSDLRRWSVVGTFPGRVGGGVLEDLQLISGRAATSASDEPAGRTQTPSSMCSTAPPPPFPSPAPKPR